MIKKKSKQQKPDVMDPKTENEKFDVLKVPHTFENGDPFFVDDGTILYTSVEAQNGGKIDLKKNGK